MGLPCFKKFEPFLILIIIALTFLIFSPKPTLAEIATTKDWIGLFNINTQGNTKSDTVNGDSWLYTNNCSQTSNINTAPKLASASGCIFNYDLPLSSGRYVFRMYANDQSLSGDSALISTSNPIDYPTTLNTSVTPTGKVYQVNGNLTLSQSLKVRLTGVVFVEGNLYINANQTDDSDTAGVVYIVNGTIYVDKSVTDIHAILITQSESGFCSSSNAGICEPTGTATSALNIKGAVIYLNNNGEPKFTRTIGTNTEPAEIVTFDPKYLVILKDLFARDLTIWSEVQ